MHVGVLYKKEIDFLAVRQGETMYIQVSDDLSSDSAFRREHEPLLAIRDAYPKMVVARTRHASCAYEEIEIVDIASWLAEPERLAKG